MCESVVIMPALVSFSFYIRSKGKNVLKILYCDGSLQIFMVVYATLLGIQWGPPT